jgi:hypothetical protein
VDFTLKVARSSETVEVSSEAPLINPENANTSTTLNAPALEDLPNPGGDLTYPLQFAPGALINTAGSSNDFVGGTNGYGNVEFNGLPALSNGYIVDGLETNDPLTNLNSGLSTNLVLGLNSISEVTVNTLSYSVDQGRYGASQVNYVTKSGTNQFHGNLYELWNGSLLNAADYFTNATPGSQAQIDGESFWGQCGRADCARQAVFFLRQRMGADRAAHRHAHDRSHCGCSNNTFCSNFLWANTDSVNNPKNDLPRRPRRCRFIKQMFSLYGNTNGTPTRCSGVLSIRTVARNPPNGNGCANRRASRTPATTTSRCRRPASTTTSTRKIRPGFVFSPTPACKPRTRTPSTRCSMRSRRSLSIRFAAGYTHVFSQNLVNYFNPAFSWYESLFGPSNLQKTLSAFPIVLQGSGANAPSRPWEGSTTPGFKAGAPPGSSSTTISPGAVALTNCGSEPIPASSA